MDNTTLLLQIPLLKSNNQNKTQLKNLQMNELNQFNPPPPQIAITIPNEAFNLESFLSKFSKIPINYDQIHKLEEPLNSKSSENDELENLLLKENQADNENQNQQINKIIDSIENYANSNLFAFDHKKTKSFKFELPPTIFPNKEEFKNNNFSKENDYEGQEFVEKINLNSSQISEIFNKGLFTVKSKRYPLDYVWKLNDYIIKGRKRITQSLKDNLDDSWEIFKKTPKRLYYNKNSEEFCQPTLFHGIKNIFKFSRNIISIFFGFPLLKLDETNANPYLLYNYYKNLNVNYNDSDQLKALKYICEGDKPIKAKLEKLYNEFDLIWKKKYNKIKLKYEDDENLKLKINKEFEEELEKYIKEHSKDLNENYLLIIFEWLKVIKLVKEIKFEFHEIYNEHYDIFKVNLLINHPFLAKFTCYNDRKIKEFIELENQKLDKEKNNKILMKLNSQNYNFYSDLMKKYNTFLETFLPLKTKLESKLRHYIPIHTKEFKKYLFPCSWTIESEKINGKNHYHVKKTEIVSHSSGHLLWRLTRLCVLYRVWVQNAMYWLFASAISGPFGIRALLGCEYFYPDKTCDDQGNLIQDLKSKTATVVVTFGNVLESIEKDRNAFEARPDHSFFGKGFNRFCNLLYNYIFKLIIIGVGFVLVCFPVLIFFNVAISLFLAITSFIWMIIVTLLYYLFNVFIYFDQEDSELYGWFPLISEFIVTLGIDSILQILIAILLFILQPILSLIVFLFAFARYLFRSLYDCFMMIFVLCFAKVPIEDSAIAWKISGPSVTRQFFKKLDLEYSLKILISGLENIELDHFKEITTEKIRKIKTKIVSFYSEITKPFFLNISFNNLSVNKSDLSDSKKHIPNVKTIDYCTNILIDNLVSSINKRKNNYPKMPNQSRFSKEDLSLFLEYSKIVIQEFIQIRNMDYIWEKQNLKPFEYDLLTEKIIASTLGSNCKETLEEVDERMELKEQRDEIDQIQNILEGGTGNPTEALGLNEKFPLKVKKEEKKKIIKYKEPVLFHFSDLNFIDEVDYKDVENAVKLKWHFSDNDNMMIDRLGKWIKEFNL